MLGRPGKEDREKMEAAFDRAAEAALAFAREGVDKAMQKGNGG